MIIYIKRFTLTVTLLIEEQGMSKKDDARQRFISVNTQYAGSAKTADIPKGFDISAPQATRDMKKFRDNHQGMIEYDLSSLSFIPKPNMEWSSELDAKWMLGIFHASMVASPGVLDECLPIGVNAEMVQVSQRLPETSVLMDITRAIAKNLQVKIKYLSMSGAKKGDLRTIEPHHIVTASGRWHVRAFCVENNEFRDFVLSRIISASITGAAMTDRDTDDRWNDLVKLTIIPHPSLSEEMQAIIAYDYRMRGNVLSIEIRKALALYLLCDMRVDCTLERELNTKSHHLALVNHDDIKDFASVLLTA